MLRNAPIRLKLTVVLLLPLLALIALSAVRTASNLAVTREADQGATETEFALAGTALAHELQAERGLSVRVLDAGFQPDARALQSQRGAVGRALEVWEARADDLDPDALEPAARDRLGAARARLGGLRGLRQDVETRSIEVAPAIEAYSAIIAELLNTNRRMLTGFEDAQLAEAATAFVTMSRVKELTAIQREQISHATLTNQRLDGGRFDAFRSQVANAEVLLAEFRAASSRAQEQLFVDTMVGPEVQRTRELRGAALAATGGEQLDIDPQEWWSVVTFELGLERRVEQRLGADAADRARSIAQAATRRSIAESAAILAVLLLSIGLSLYVARLLVNPLRRLRAGADRVAQVQLPGIVERLQRAERIDLEAETAPIQVRSGDEVGQVAGAFNAVHSVAVRVAAEQAALREGVGSLFLNLGQRIQGLVSGQLQLLDELERSELDPEQLGSLFRLDHMATRMRRNAESLLVLAGAEPSRRWDEPIALAGILRAATAEIEDYTRIILAPVADVRVAGQAVSDVVHLIAELLENATKFSPAGTQVQVNGEVAPRGYMVEIEDQGVGMTDAELEQVNQRLAEPPVVDLITEHRLGVFVVGRLALKHGIRVRLRRSWYGGVTALVLLPNGLIINPDAPAQPAAGHGTLDRARDMPALTRPSLANGSASRHAGIASRLRPGEPAGGLPGVSPFASPAPRLGRSAFEPRPGRQGWGRRQATPAPDPSGMPLSNSSAIPGSRMEAPTPNPGEPVPEGMQPTAAPAAQPGAEQQGSPLPRRLRGARAGAAPAPAPGEPLGGPPRAPLGPGGLPRRVRGANLAPGVAGAGREPAAAPERAAPEGRRALSDYQSGVTRGRNDAMAPWPQPDDERGAAES
jgi:HAMP domain-containing protein